MSKQQELFEKAKEIKSKFDNVVAIIQNDYDLYGDLSFDDWLEWINVCVHFEKELEDYLDEINDYIFEKVKDK